MTFHAAPNHGAALQAYALQTHLQKIGQDTFFINYQLGGGILPRGMYRWISRTPSGTINKIQYQLRIKPFIRFQQEYLKIGEQYYSDHVQLQNDSPIADAYICGSDQIWNPRFIKKETDEHAYWLDFVPMGQRRIAYAASFGVDELDNEVGYKYANYAKKFHSISVREKGSISLMQKFGLDNVLWVPDPTLLLNKTEYEMIEKKNTIQDKNYIFSYILGFDNAELALLIKKSIGKYFNINCHESYRKSLLHNLIYNGYIGPGEWIANLRQSSFVITNSFHATVFSILFNKSFVVLLRKGYDSGMNNRINSLLDVVGLQHRAVSSYEKSNIEWLCKENIDWGKVDEKVKAFRADGVDFINKSLL